MNNTVNILEAAALKKADKLARDHFEEQLVLIKASIMLVSQGGSKFKSGLMQKYLDLYEADQDEGRRAILINSALVIAVDALLNLIGSELSKKLIEPRLVVSKLLQILGADLE